MALSSIVLLVLAGIVCGSTAADRKWDGLRVRWGIKVDDPSNLIRMPRTFGEGLAQTPMFFPNKNTCEGGSYRGLRTTSYLYGQVVSMLYGKQGYIAGIQTGIKAGLDHGYPPPSLQPPFVREGGHYLLTAYFVDPATICTTGRTQQDFDRDGTGTNLYFQFGADPEKNSYMIPRNESDLAGSLWTKGGCVPTLGQHYWYNLKKDMSCDGILPLFLLYNDGKLTGFGWGLTADVEDPFMERPHVDELHYFMKDVPTCLTERRLSALHFFLTDDYANNRC